MPSTASCSRCINAALMSQRDGSFVITVEHVSDLFKEEKGKRKSFGFRFSFTYRWGQAPVIGGVFTALFSLNY